MAIPISYNLRNVTQRPWSTLATTLGIALVVAILVGAFALASGFQAALVETGSPENLIVLRTGADSEISSGVSRDAANILRALPDVQTGPDGPLASAEMVVLINQPRLGQDGSSNVTVRGVDAEGMHLRGQVKVVEGRMFTPGTDEVIVARRMARRFASCGIGDRLRFGQRDFSVVGHFTAGGSGFDSEIWGDNAVLMPALNRENAFQSVTLRMRDTTRFAALKKELEADPRLGVQVRTERGWYSEQSALMATIIRVGGVFITLIMAVGAIFGAMNTMFAAVKQRTREIAVLLTLGFTPFAITLSFLIESVLIALIGGLAGCLIALPINGITTSTTNWSSFSEVAFAFRVTPIGMIAGLVFAAGLGLVGGFLPAFRAGRQPLAAGIRAA
ncbi:MAG: ABC transporter permease [Candidatus Eiseniibacteriota bacterium]